jgi:hypothetical protein
MTDFTIADSDIVDQHESILIHLFYSLLDYNYRNGMFTDESSIYDMGAVGLSTQDFIDVANQYYKQTSDFLSYSEGQKLYYKILNKAFDNMIFEKFEKTYGFPLDSKIHLLKDIALLLKDKFPARNWDTDIIFILKKFDNQQKQEDISQNETKTETTSNVIKLPVRKKPTPDEVRNGTNSFLMQSVLGLSWEDAEKLASENYEKKMLGKKFEPYIPNEN